MHSDEVNQEIMMAELKEAKGSIGELKEAKGSIGWEESASENRNRMIGTPMNLGDAVEELL